MVLAGLGTTDLPPLYCSEELADGRLVHLLPQWTLPSLNLHAVYPSRLGLTLAVRTLIDFLAAHFGSWLEAAQNTTRQLPAPPTSSHSSIIG
jgi:DNA-binding transcriptional LysR family regulator